MQKEVLCKGMAETMRVTRKPGVLEQLSIRLLPNRRAVLRDAFTRPERILTRLDFNCLNDFLLKWDVDLNAGFSRSQFQFPILAILYKLIP
jgi:hypothetical protein